MSSMIPIVRTSLKLSFRIVIPSVAVGLCITAMHIPGYCVMNKQLSNVWNEAAFNNVMILW
jgi:NO-binding membrane sensor protein with MHYT domain